MALFLARLFKTAPRPRRPARPDPDRDEADRRLHLRRLSYRGLD